MTTTTTYPPPTSDPDLIATAKRRCDLIATAKRRCGLTAKLESTRRQLDDAIGRSGPEYLA